MKLPVIRRFDRQDLASKGELPAWIDVFLQALNQFVDPVASALQGRLTLKDNMQGKLITQTFTHGVELAVNPQIATSSRLKVSGMRVVAISSGYLLDAWGYSVKNDGSMGITLRFLKPDGSAVGAGTTVQCDVWIDLG